MANVVTGNAASRSAKVRSQLSHPVVDGDGHWLEPVAIFLEFLAEEGGPRLVDEFRREKAKRDDWYAADPGERMRRRLRREAWWGEPASTLDRATVSVPGLLAERLQEFGIDYAVVYPTLGLTLRGIADVELRRASVRALNRMNAELFAPYAFRLTPAATVMVNTPDEAIEDLDFAVSELGMKVIMVSGSIMRGLAGDGTQYVDTIGLDSPFDYDPFWQRCVELGVAVTDHGGSLNWPDRFSPNNYVFNHIGHFSNGLHASCRAIFLGGVTRRFPSLPFAFLEGGVGWASNLLLDLVSHFEKRNVTALEKNLCPTNIDFARFRDLYDRHAEGRMAGRFDDVVGSVSSLSPFHGAKELAAREGAAAYDDFAALGVFSAEELRSEFRRSFYFGCEADDPMTAVAFNAKLGTLVRPIFSSDVGHFDVIEMSDVLHEAWELVDDELISGEEFRQFTFENIVHLHTGLNPKFFEGTAVANDVAQVVERAKEPGHC